MIMKTGDTKKTSVDSERAPQVGPVAREREILKEWTEKDIFTKSLDQTKEGKPYIFYDGPPFATGLPHYGHFLAGTIKDVIPRYQTMRGRFVRREWGWDCHGLPVENLIEKELGFRTKKDIEDYGIGAFNEKARGSVLQFDKEWKEIIPRLGRFVDMEHGYKTMDASYTESIWWAFKTLHDKKLIYEGYKAMHICPRCETTLAASEVADGYKDVKDISVYVKFALTDEPHTYFLAWTTTPWTLPGNVALAVSSSTQYVVLSVEDVPTEKLICAKERIADVLKERKYTIIEERSGKDLVGKSYLPVFDYYAKDKDLPHHANGWKVYAADFVTADSGTGIVHIAPAFGEDDMALGKAKKLPFIQHVGMDGKMRPEVTDLAGEYVKPKSDDDKTRLGTDIAIIRLLQEKGAFFAKENITHSYPHCWRCDWPLLNYAASSWFVAVTDLGGKLLAANENISWVPAHIGPGRFGKWLDGARDWAISRSRFWGAPIPAWKCNKCDKIDIIGSIADLKKKTSRRNRFIVMRHGESQSNVRQIVTYKADDPYPLTEKGREQVAVAAGTLAQEKIDLIIASPLLRTRETATLIAEEIGIPSSGILFDARLSEANTGTFNGKSVSEYRAYFSSVLEKLTKRPPEGETLAEMKARLADFLYATDAAYEGKTILIVTHEYAAWLFDAIAAGMTNEEAAELRDGEGEDYIKNAESRDLPFALIPHNEDDELDFHRPYIDAVRYHCTCELGTMERVPEVFDCWFESGAMPFAQFHYMGDDTTSAGRLFRSQFPADFIAEGLDQTRGWFYTQLILGIGLFGQSPYKSVIVNGIILAENGEKMSKRLKNYPDPMGLVERYGADALRFYLMSSPAVRGESLCFSESGVDDIFKKIVLRLGNVITFLETYGDGEGRKPSVSRDVPVSTHILDRWITLRYAETLSDVSAGFDARELDRALRPIPKFVDDLSAWYLRRSRERLKGDDVADRVAAKETLAWILLSFARLIAPVMPFLAEDIYSRLDVKDGRESVHLESWPDAPRLSDDEKTLLVGMESARAVVTGGLDARASAGIKVRQPLASLTGPALPPDLAAIVIDEVNVKEYRAGETITIDTILTPELREEGQIRDLVRRIQDLRKKEDLIPSDKITLTIFGDEAFTALVQKNEKVLAAQVGARTIKTEEGEENVQIERE